LSDSTLRKDIWSIIGVITAMSLISVIVVLIVTEQAISKQTEDILEQKAVTANVLASRFQLRIADATSALEIAARSEEFASADSLDAVSEQYKGLPIGYEEEKRKIAKDVLEEYDSFETFAFALPNGDIYFVEPHDRQLSLPRLNYADRDWHRMPIATGQPFAADALISTATDHRVIPIGIPVYADESLVGVVVGAMDLENLESQLRSELNLSDNNRVVYVDDKGNAIEDLSSTSSDTYTSIASLAHLQSVKKVIGGEAGHLIESIDSNDILTVYRPTTIDGRNWGVLVMQPVSDAFSTIEFLRNQAYTMLAILIGISAASGYFLISFRINSTLAKELAKANAILIEKERMKDDFLKLASHELRTPIQPILGYSSLGMRGLVNDDRAWHVVHKEAQRLMKLANNIVDITMIQSGMMSYEMTDIKIMDIVQSSVDGIRTAAEERHLTLDLSVDAKCQEIAVHVDASRLKRVFDEILENAIKFTSKGGIRVECKPSQESQEFLVRFSDTGTAIAPEMLPRIFDIFASKSVNDPTTQGAGLGLFICQAIVRAHQGTIVVQNISDGTGVVFEVRLPISSQYRSKKIDAQAN